jgi:hypothetical protein
MSDEEYTAAQAREIARCIAGGMLDHTANCDICDDPWSDDCEVLQAMGERYAVWRDRTSLAEWRATLPVGS